MLTKGWQLFLIVGRDPITSECNFEGNTVLVTGVGRWKGKALALDFSVLSSRSDTIYRAMELGKIHGGTWGGNIL